MNGTTTKTYACRFGCPQAVTQMSRLVGHYKGAHPDEYAAYKAAKPPRANGGRSRPEPEPEEPEDAETTLLFSATALFADAKLEPAAYGRVTAYLQTRFGPAPAALTAVA
jgi:hypothetical protein